MIHTSVLGVKYGEMKDTILASRSFYNSREKIYI